MERRRIAQQKLRFAILLDGPTVPDWAACCLRSLLASRFASLVLSIVVEPATGIAPSPRPSLYRPLLVRRSPAVAPVNISHMLGRAETMSCRAQADGSGGLMLVSAEVDAIRAQALDFILHLGSRTVSGELLRATRLGIWTFSHLEDERRGRICGFWEILAGTVTIASLQRLRVEGEPVPLYSGAFPTRRSCRANQDAIRYGTAGWCASFCARIVLGQGHERQGAEIPSTGSELPNPASIFRYLLLQARQFLAEQWRRMFLIEIWNVGIVDASRDTILREGRMPPPNWLRQHRRHGFAADPAIVTFGSERHLFFEEFSYRSGKGWISRQKIDEERRLAPLPAVALPDLALPCHMSYPHLLESGGRIFCVPETSELGKVLLFEARKFPDSWQEPVTLIEDFPALDSTVFAHGGRWWIFCTNAAAAPERELHAWFSDRLKGPWRAHPLNPLCCDIRSARPAGPPFVVDGVLFRPGQDCSRSYGGAITIMRVDTLTPTQFAETPVRRIAPDPRGAYPAGLHTIAGAGELTVIDGKRLVFSPIAFALHLLVRFQTARRHARLRRAAVTGRSPPGSKDVRPALPRRRFVS